MILYSRNYRRLLNEEEKWFVTKSKYFNIQINIDLNTKNIALFIDKKQLSLENFFNRYNNSKDPKDFIIICDVISEIYLNYNFANNDSKLFRDIFIINKIDLKNIKLNENLINDLEIVKLERYNPITLKPYIKDGKFIVKFPERVNGDFICSDMGLVSLEGCPKEVTGRFYCHNNNLTSLKGCPERVGKSFFTSDNKIISLIDAPKYIGKDFDCSRNELIDLKGSPMEINGDFYISENNLKTLKGCTKNIGGKFDCSNNKLTSLEGGPEKIGNDYWCHNNFLTSLKGSPEVIKGDFSCYRNELKSLEYGPKEVNGFYDCTLNTLETLNGVAKYIGKDLEVYNNKKNFIITDLPKDIIISGKFIN